MNTKTEQISSGLVAVAEVGSGFSIRWTKPDYGGSCKPYDMLVRLSDAEAIISAKDAEILEQCRINGMGAEREATLLGRVERQSAALKLAKEALTEVQDLIGESSGVYGLHLNSDESPWSEVEQGGRFERLTTLLEALAAIDALKGE